MNGSSHRALGRLSPATTPVRVAVPATGCGSVHGPPKPDAERWIVQSHISRASRLAVPSLARAGLGLLQSGIGCGVQGPSGPGPAWSTCDGGGGGGGGFLSSAVCGSGGGGPCVQSTCCVLLSPAPMWNIHHVPPSSTIICGFVLYVGRLPAACATNGPSGVAATA
jgi:hypothetical protein